MDMGKIKQQVLDRLVGKVVSRKLLVWIVATIGVPLHFIDGDQWMQISIIYIGSQAVITGITEYVRASKGLPSRASEEG